LTILPFQEAMTQGCLIRMFAPLMTPGAAFADPPTAAMLDPGRIIAIPPIAGPPTVARWLATET
jgi:hypothetical protein